MPFQFMNIKSIRLHTTVRNTYLKSNYTLASEKFKTLRFLHKVTNSPTTETSHVDFILVFHLLRLTQGSVCGRGSYTETMTTEIKLQPCHLVFSVQEKEEGCSVYF